MFKLLNLVFLIHLILPVQLIAETAKPLVLEEGKSTYLIRDYVVIFDGGGNMGFPGDFSKHIDDQQSLHPDSIDKDQIYIYGYFDLKNNNKTHLNWWINFANNDYVTVLIGEKIFKTGYLVKGSEKPIIAGSYYVPVTLANDQVQRIFFKIEKDFHDFNLNFKIDNEIDRINSLWYKKLWAMALQGILLIMAIYGLLIYFRLKEKVYLFYSLYLISTSLFYLFVDSFLREYLIPELPKLSYLGVIALYPSAIFYFHFLKRFIDFEKVKRWLYLLINKTLYASYFLTAIAIIVFVSGNEQYLEPISQVFIMLNASIALTSLAYLIYSKNKMVRYFILGSTFLLISAIVDALLWDSDLVWGNFTRLGLVIEICFFSLGLGERVRYYASERSKTQQELIAELERSKNYIESQKDLLETKVIQRTAELGRQNRELIVAKEEADKALKAKSDFLSIMSHEIRTPMNGVIGMTHLLLDEINNPQHQENLESLKFSAENLLTLLNDILDFNKIDSGNVELEDTGFNIKQLVRNLQYQFALRAKEKGIDFIVEVDENIPVLLKGDPARITQILMNLLSNAIKFTKEGQVELKVNLSETTDDFSELNFEVIDSGIGIAEDKQTVIFDQFTQENTDTSRKFGGTGLGLAIIKKLLELMDSSIQLESARGNGAKFYFSLKLRNCDAKQVITKETATSRTALIQNLRVLSVDDNEMNRIVLDKFLKKWQVQAHDSVASGDEAISLLIQNDYDLILLDLQMPDVNGYQVAEIIRTMDGPKYQNIPIIALSADIFANVSNEIRKFGMNDFVSKPFNPQILIETICKNLHQESQ